MDKRTFKQYLLLIVLGIAIFAALTNLSQVGEWLSSLTALIAPIITGLIMAFVLSIPMGGLSKRLSRAFPKLGKRWTPTVSLVLTLVLVLAVIAAVFILAVPQLISSVMSVSVQVKEYWPQVAAFLSGYGIDTQYITDWITTLDWKTAFEHVFTGAGAVLGSVVDIAGSTISGAVNVLFAVVIAAYVLLGTDELGQQVNGFLDAFFKPRTANGIRRVAVMTQQTFAKFLSGQCVEVLILGILIFISFSVFSIPYAGLTAVLTAVCAFIPYIGAFASCAIGVLLTLLTSPGKALLCLIVYLCVQFIESQFIYPHVVGGSVGLSPLWTLVAALLGGKLFGLLGMIFFIPLLAVIFELLHEAIERRRSENGTAAAADECPPAE